MYAIFDTMPRRTASILVSENLWHIGMEKGPAFVDLIGFTHVPPRDLLKPIPHLIWFVPNFLSAGDAAAQRFPQWEVKPATVVYTSNAFGEFIWKRMQYDAEGNQLGVWPD